MLEFASTMAVARNFIGWGYYWGGKWVAVDHGGVGKFFALNWCILVQK